MKRKGKNNVQTKRPAARPGRVQGQRSKVEGPESTGASRASLKPAARSLKPGAASPRPRPAFSLAEMMIAVVILGIGLLITSSMFPIAWFKARDVAEFTNVTTATDAAELSTEIFTDVNGFKQRDSALFPGDWFASTTTNSFKALSEPLLYPDTRVHPFNLGNLLVDFSTAGVNPFKPGDPNDLVPIADNPWRLDDNLFSEITVDVTNIITSLHAAKANVARIAVTARLIPPMEPLSTAKTAEERLLWKAQFDSRRYCWSVLVRTAEMPGPQGGSGSLWNDCNAGSTNCNAAALDTQNKLQRPRRLSLYYVTLKRPAGARYAQQVGFSYDGTSVSWPANGRPDKPRALPPDKDMLLPTPWRIEAELLNPPELGDEATGIPSEIQLNDPVISTIVQVGTRLIDDRTGQVFTVAARRELPADPDKAICTLDREYTSDDIYRANYVPFPHEDGSVTNAERENWMNYWQWIAGGCDEDPTLAACSATIENEPERRFYWVYPPPVDAERRATGVPLFDGSPPVVGIEIRQMEIRPQ